MAVDSLCRSHVPWFIILMNLKSDTALLSWCWVNPPSGATGFLLPQEPIVYWKILYASYPVVQLHR